MDSVSGEFTFAMGEFEATFPLDRGYVSNHMWAVEVSAERFRFGLTAYAVRLLQDVYFLDWLPDDSAPVALRQNIGSIESKKAESDLYAPAAGIWRGMNEEALDDPSVINADTYGAGWLFEMQAAAGDWLMTPDDYRQHLKSAWLVAQRTIRGQTNA